MRYLCYIAFIILSAFIANSQVVDNALVEAALNEQFQRYPASTLADVYKNFFHDTFGPGHLVNNPEAARAYIMEELQQTDSVSQYPDYEPVGWKNRFVRVNLSVVKSGRVPVDTLLEALVVSAGKPVDTSVEQWSVQWAEIQAIVVRKYPSLAGFEEDAAAIAQVLAKGKYAMHHSQIFNDLYKPHYRLISTDIFEKMILPLL